MDGTDGRRDDPSVLVTIWKLEAMSERLRHFARREGVDVAEMSRALEVRATLDGHLLAIRVLRSSGASTGSVASIVARATEVFDAALGLLGSDVVRPV